MDKAIVSNRIYFKIPDNPKPIMDALTYKIEVNQAGRGGKFKSIELIKNYKIHAGGLISIPQCRFDLIPENHEIVDKRVKNEVPFPTPRIPLRDVQDEIVQQVEDTCFLNAKPGWGKTFTAMHMAVKLGQKTLVITHTTALRDQWIKEAEQLFGTSVGKIGSGVFDIEDHFIVIGNVQTIVKMIDRISKEFGTVILDEAHHVPASTFASIVDGMYARYRIGLSGTMERKDKKHVIFRDYFGSTVFRPEASHTMDPVIKVLKTGIMLTPGKAWVQQMNDLLYDEDYQTFIAGIAKGMISIGHKVLIPADRTEFLERVKDKIGESCILITGETSLEERDLAAEKIEAGEADSIAASRQIFAEGISINPLSCLILAVPSNNPVMIEQLIGRVNRLCEGKLQPVVVDLQFKGATATKQNAARIAFYMSKGWKVETYD